MANVGEVVFLSSTQVCIRPISATSSELQNHVHIKFSYLLKVIKQIREGRGSSLNEELHSKPMGSEAAVVTQAKMEQAAIIKSAWMCVYHSASTRWRRPVPRRLRLRAQTGDLHGVVSPVSFAQNVFVQTAASIALRTVLCYFKLRWEKRMLRAVFVDRADAPGDDVRCCANEST